jgi:hypothetical protein
MNKTPEELAQVYINNLAIYKSEYPLARSCFLAGYQSRDLEVTSLEGEIAMLKAELREVGNE